MGNLVDKIFDYTIRGLDRTMDLTWKRNTAIVSNIANAETPKYRAIDLDFKDALKVAFSKEDEEGAISSSTKARYVPDLSGVTKQDGNNVDLDIQIGKLMQNSGKYKTAAAILRKKLRMTRMAITFAQR